MSIEKSVYQAPEGLDTGLPEEGAIEIEIVDPEMVSIDDGSVEITLIGGEDLPMPVEFTANLAEYLEDEELEEIAEDLLESIQSDMDGRKEWVDAYIEGLNILGLKYEERTEPWENACGVNSSILLEAAIRFQADTMSEVFPAQGPVKVKIVGEDDKEAKAAAERVRVDMNYQLTEEMVEYRSEHERLLFSLGLSGSAFKKIYYDPNLGRQVATFLPAEEVVVPYGVSHLETAERVTHIMRKTRNEVHNLMAMGFYREIDLGDPVPFHLDVEQKKAEDAGIELNDDDRYSLYEVHADIRISADEDDDAIAKPYVITIEHGSNKVLSIRRNWREEDSTFTKRNHFVHYPYVPGFGFYGLGLIHIIGGYARAGTSIIRQMVDAGTLANLPAGLKSRGLRIKGDNTPIGPGEFRDVDVPSGAIKDNIMPLPYKEPSQVLLTLLDRITNEGRRLGAINDINISDMSANAPVGTTLALLERTLKPMTAVQARVHYAMKKEFKILKEIIADYAPLEYEYRVENGQYVAKRDDYARVEVIPVSDPNASTMAQRVVQYQAVLQMAQQAPQVYDVPQLHRQMLEVMNIKDAAKIVPLPEDTSPTDPVTENMRALTGTPIKAFLNQDHEAHIATHIQFMQDPTIAQTIGQNPQANQIMAALQAHIAEHAAFRYRKQIEEKLGVTLPPMDEELPENIEVEISRLMADAATQNTAANKQKVAAQQAQQQMQDPVIQMQMQEQQRKQQELQHKMQKDAKDAQLKEQELMRKAMKDQMDHMIDQKEVELEQADLALNAKKQGADFGLRSKEAATKRVDEALKSVAPPTNRDPRGN